MGWFKIRKKSEEEKNNEEQVKGKESSEPQMSDVIQEPPKVKSHEEILREQNQNESEFLESEIKIKEETLESISKKLASVKEEYDTAVSN